MPHPLHVSAPPPEAQGAAVVLLLNAMADAHELALLEDEEVVLWGERLEASDGLVREVGDQVDVRLEDANVGAET